MDLAKYSAIPEIPFYADGEITAIGTDTLKALEGGHHPWLNHAETIVATKLNNLVPRKRRALTACTIIWSKKCPKRARIGRHIEFG